MLRIAIAQINPTVGDIESNQEKILQFIELAKNKQADIVVFPELSICGYPPEDLLYKEYFVNDVEASLKAISKKTKGICAIVGFVQRDQSQKLYNAAAIISDQKVQGVYRKEELPNYGVFDEKRYFVEGKNNSLFQIENVLLGINICEDIWVDEGPYLSQAKGGAKVIINISSSPYTKGKIKEREVLLAKRAKETGCHILYVNMAGGQDELVFDGSSCIVSPQGKVLAAGKCFEEDMFFADIDFSKKKARKNKKIVNVPHKLTQKIERIMFFNKKNVSEIEKMYKALILGTRDYVFKNGFRKVVIGLSGGIDSALVAAIAVDAIGKNNVIGVTMPSRYTSKGTRTDATRLADNLDIQLIEIPIENICSSYEKALQGEFAKEKKGVAEENIQARVRGNLLMALSNKFGWLVLTTGNKSEFAVGYCTLYGDMSGGFAVIKDIPKTKVYSLSEFINSHDKVIIPLSIIARAPSAELRENQKDQDSLPPYALLDDMLKQYVEQHKSIVKNAKGENVSVAKRIMFLVDKSEYKRRQSPPGIKITNRSFGKDWRLPITNKYKEKL